MTREEYLRKNIIELQKILNSNCWKNTNTWKGYPWSYYNDRLMNCKAELKGIQEERERIEKILRQVKKNTINCSHCDGCNCDLCYFERELKERIEK